jgi:AcrR family transcriptional regulator
MNAKTVEPERRSARERLLAAADELFYEGGTHAVGIDRVIERAGVAKASLYDNFGSKEELIRAYLLARQEVRKARITARLERYDTPRERLLGVFDGLGEIMAEPRFRGCAFQRAGAESNPGGAVKAVCVEARVWTRELFASLARDAGARHPEELAQQFMLLYDGALVSAHMEGGMHPALAARAAAALMLDTDIGKTPSRARKEARS